MYMNTKRQKRQKQSKKVKRKTKTYKKRNIRKYGGGDEIYLKSFMKHGFTSKPIYKFQLEMEAGKGGFAQSNLGKISCEPQKKCIKSSGSVKYTENISKFSKTLQNMHNKMEPEEDDNSFPYDKEYILRVYGRKMEKDYVKREINGTEYHKELSQTCSNYVCILFDYGKIVDKMLGKFFPSKYDESRGKCKKEENCLYALLEKGKMDMMEYLNRHMTLKLLYVIAMKMIRNIHCLHNQNILHYDIKLENCVFFPIGENKEVEHGEEIVEKICDLKKDFINDVKLIDFGFSSKNNDDVENILLYDRNCNGTLELIYNHSNIYKTINKETYEDNVNGSKEINSNTPLKMYCKHSRFTDIFAILKDISLKIEKMRNKPFIKSESIFKFISTQHIWYKTIVKKEEKIRLSGRSNLPTFLNEQRELLEGKEEIGKPFIVPEFSNVPYQNILDKLKEEYLDLDRSSQWW